MLGNPGSIVEFSSVRMLASHFIFLPLLLFWTQQNESQKVILLGRALSKSASEMRLSFAQAVWISAAASRLSPSHCKDWVLAAARHTDYGKILAATIALNAPLYPDSASKMAQWGPPDLAYDNIVAFLSSSVAVPKLSGIIESAIRNIRSTQPGPGSEMLVSRIAVLAGKFDPQLAVRIAEGIEDASIRSQALASTAQYQAVFDPEGCLELARSLPSSTLKWTALAGILQTVPVASPSFTAAHKALLESVRSETDDSADWDTVAKAAAVLACAQTPESSSDPLAQVHSSVELLYSIPASRRSANMAYSVWVASKVSPASAAQLARHLLPDTPLEPEPLHLIASYEPLVAARFALNLPQMSSVLSVLDQCSRHPSRSLWDFLRRELPQLADEIAQEKDAVVKTLHTAQLAAIWTAVDPSQAEIILAQLPKSELGDPVRLSVALRLAERDLAAARKLASACSAQSREKFVSNLLTDPPRQLTISDLLSLKSLLPHPLPPVCLAAQALVSAIADQDWSLAARMWAENAHISLELARKMPSFGYEALVRRITLVSSPSLQVKLYCAAAQRLKQDAQLARKCFTLAQRQATRLANKRERAALLRYIAKEALALGTRESAEYLAMANRVASPPLPGRWDLEGALARTLYRTSPRLAYGYLQRIESEFERSAVLLLIAADLASVKMDDLEAALR